MATLKFPTNVSKVTFAVSGMKVPDAANHVSGLTPSEVTSILHKGGVRRVSTSPNGDLNLSLPIEISSLEVDGVTYTVNGAATVFGKMLDKAMPALAATILLSQNINLVQG